MDDPFRVGRSPRAADAIAELGTVAGSRSAEDTLGERHKTGRVCPRHLLAPPVYHEPAGESKGSFSCGVCGRPLVKRQSYLRDLMRRLDWEEAVR